MNLLPDALVQTLPDWLAIATRGLTGASKDRIRLEIESHYSQAVEAHRENGASESAALAAALAELGDAHAAAKRFRKRHLTRWEVEKLKKSDKEARSVLNLLFSYFFFLILTVCALRWEAFIRLHEPPIYFAVQFVFLIALPTICFLIAGYAEGKPNGRLLLIQSLSSFWIPVFFYQVTAPELSPPSVAVLICVPVLVASLPRFLMHLHLAIRLCKVRAAAAKGAS